MSNVPTDRRAVVKVLLRWPPGATQLSSQRRMAGFLVTILGAAREGEWGPGVIRPGDLEGLVWTTPRQVNQVVNLLRQCEGVVDARGTGEG